MRKKKLLMNTVSGIIQQVVTVICGFILPQYMLLYYGSAVNGLISSITHFLAFISLLDMGVGAVIKSNLYKPLADKDMEQISRIIKASDKFFHRLAYIFGGYIAILCFLFASKFNTGYGSYFTVSLLLIIAISMFAQYFWGMTYKILLNADQRSYVPLCIQTGAIILNTTFAVLLMRQGAPIHVVKLMTATVYVLRPVVQLVYVRKHYCINKKIKVIDEPIHQKWNGFAQHLSSVVCKNVDVVVLTLFSTLENISIYSVYFMITDGIGQIIIMAATGIESFFGSMIAKNESMQLLKAFNFVEWVVHTIVILAFTITGVLIIPFISVYTKAIQDVDYIVPLFGTLLVSAYAVECLRIPYFSIIKAAGHFKETQNGSYIAAILNVLITMALVFKYGLIGVAVGTLVAMFYHTCYFVWYLQKNILKRSAKYFFGYVLIDLLIVVLSYTFTKSFILDGLTYVAWVILAVKVTLIVIIISMVVNLIFFKNQIMELVNSVKRVKNEK